MRGRGFGGVVAKDCSFHRAGQALTPNDATHVKAADLFSSLVTTKPGGTSVSTRTRTLTNTGEIKPTRSTGTSLWLLAALLSVAVASGVSMVRVGILGIRLVGGHCDEVTRIPGKGPHVLRVQNERGGVRASGICLPQRQRKLQGDPGIRRVTVHARLVAQLNPAFPDEFWLRAQHRALPSWLLCRRWDSNPHWRAPKARASAVGLRRPCRISGALGARPGHRVRAQTPRSLRSLATWPVARTLYSALPMRPWASITKVDRITPVTVLPYICFSP